MATNAAQAANQPAATAASGIMPMDAGFIERNQIVERYLAGKLPPRGAVDFERWCQANPGLVESLGLTDRINAALRLLDASGQPLPWTEKKRRFYEQPLAFAGAAALALILAVSTLMLLSRAQDAERQVTLLERQVADRPLKAASTTRTIIMEPSRTGPSQRPATTLNGGIGEMADLKIDVSWSRYTNFRVQLDRIDQGRVATFGNFQRDSNGHLRLAINSSALGPGDYQLAMDGLDWRGNPQPQAWITFSVSR